MPMGQQPQAQSPQDMLVRPDVVPPPAPNVAAHMAGPPAPQSDIMNLMLNVLQGVQEGTTLGGMLNPGSTLGAPPERPMPWTQTGSMIGSMVAEPMPDILPALASIPVFAKLMKSGRRLQAPISDTGHTLERLGNLAEDPYAADLDMVLGSQARAHDPPPLDLDEFKEQAAETFDFRSLESSDHYDRYDAPKPQHVIHSTNPLTEAIVQGATEPYAQSWTIRTADGDPKWKIDTDLSIYAIPVEGGVKEAPTLVMDIASKIDEGVYAHATEEGFNDLGTPALHEAAANILAWYKQHGLQPEYVGGWRVRIKRDRQMTVPVEKIQKEFERAWIAAFGTAALVPTIILEQNVQPQGAPSGG